METDPPSGRGDCLLSGVHTSHLRCFCAVSRSMGPWSPSSHHVTQVLAHPLEARAPGPRGLFSAGLRGVPTASCGPVSPRAPGPRGFRPPPARGGGLALASERIGKWPLLACPCPLQGPVCLGGGSSSGAGVSVASTVSLALVFALLCASLSVWGRRQGGGPGFLGLP